MRIRGLVAVILVALGAGVFAPASAQEAPPRDAAGIRSRPGGADPAAALGIAVREMVRRQGRSIVQVIRGQESGPVTTARGSRRLIGSGVSIGDGFLLTSAGVVGPAGEVLVVPEDGDTLVARVRGVDRLSNLALLETPGLVLPALPVAEGALVLPGTWVVALGLGAPGTPRATFGTVFVGEGPGLGFSEIEMIQATCPLFRGYTGGALLDRDGRLLGVISGVMEDPPRAESGDAGADFLAGVLYEGTLQTITPSASTLVIPIGPALEIAQQLRGAGFVKRGYLGLQVELRAEDAPAQPTRRRGVMVHRVVPGGPAARAGILPGDVVLHFGDTRVDGAQDLSFLVISHLPGAEVRLRVLRRGRIDVRTVRIEQAPTLPWEPQSDDALAAREAELAIPAMSR